MAAILTFAFEVVHMCFLGQARMHVCVHLYTRACTLVHGYRYGSRYVHVQCVGNGFSMAAIFFCPSAAFQSHQSDFYIGFPLRVVVIRFSI